MATVSDDATTDCGATAASSTATAASITVTAASDVIQESPDVSAITEPCYARYEAPCLGLLDNEYVLRDGNIGRPVVLNGEERPGLKLHELILRGGRLSSPGVLNGLEMAKR